MVQAAWKQKKETDVRLEEATALPAGWAPEPCRPPLVWAPSATGASMRKLRS